jgi:hypothetical protein
MRFYDVPVNRSVPTEANRGLTSYSGDPERAQLTVQRCGNCSETGHNAQPCNKDAEISSESDASTTYTGFLFELQ